MKVDHLISIWQEFLGNVDQSSVVMQRLIVPVKTRFVRLYVSKFHPGPNQEACMRIELYGCKKGKWRFYL